MRKSTLCALLVACCSSTVLSSTPLSNPGQGSAAVNGGALVQALANPLQKRGGIVHPSAQSRQTVSLRRHLTTGDFAAFNELFKNAEIQLPDAEVSDRYLGIKLTLKVHELYCQDIAIGDVELSYAKESDQNVTFSINVVNLTMNCFANYDYDYGFVDGSGDLVANTSGSQGLVVISLSSPSFEEEPPSEAVVDSCQTTVNIYHMDFNGGLISSVLDMAQNLVGNIIENQLEDLACKELSSLGPTLFNDLLAKVKDILDVFLQPIPMERSDPLIAESDIQPTKGVELLNLKEINGTLGFLLDQVNTALNNVVEDPNAPDGTGADLYVNVLLRKSLLDADRAFRFNFTDLPSDTFDPVLFDSHDKLTRTSISVDKVAVFGLDTLQSWNPLALIGNYTLQDQLTWDFLTFDLDLTISIKPSTDADAILVNADPTVHIVENVKVSFGVDNLNAALSVLIGIDQIALGDLELGQLLFSENLFPCFMSLLHNVNVSGLAVSVDNIREPTLSGFVSPGIDRVVTTLAEVGFLVFEPTVMRAIPYMFQVKVRDILNEQIVTSFLSMDHNCQTNLSQVSEKYVNFNDFFASDFSDSAALPFGDIPGRLKKLLDTKVLATESGSSRSKINDLVIAPLTELVSGTDGEFVFPGNQFHLELDGLVPFGLETLSFSLFDSRIQNLDSIQAPVVLLEPSSKNDNLLNNSLVFSPQNDTFRFAMSALFKTTGDESLSSSNNVEVSFEVNKVDVLAGLVARILSQKMLHIPLKKILEKTCLVTILDIPALDENGEISDGSSPAIYFENFLLSLSSLRFDAKCSRDGACDSLGVPEISNVLSLMAESGASSLLESKIPVAIEEFVGGQYVQSLIDRTLNRFEDLCTGTSTEMEQNFSSGLPPLSRQTQETLVFLGACAFDVFAAVTASNQALKTLNASDPLSAQASADYANTTLMNFTDLNSTVGGWADVLIGQARSYLGKSDGSTLGINSLLRSFILSNDRILRLTGSKRIGNSAFGVTISEIRIAGLDSFSKFDVFEAIAPQTLRNQIQLDKVTVEIDLSVGPEDSSAEQTSPFTLVLALKSVKASLSLFLAIDQGALGDLHLGQLLYTDQILKCLLSAARDVSFTELDVTVGSIRAFELRGFEDSTMSATAASLSKLMLYKYQDTILSGLKNGLAGSLRTMLNNWVKFYLAQDSHVSCPSISTSPQLSPFVDFRDLFLRESDAVRYGAKGDSPYGDLFRNLRKIITENLIEVDPETNTSAVNSVLISKLLEGQSKQPGTLSFPGSLFDQDSRVRVGGLDATVKIRVSDLYIRHVDTFGAPISLLDAVSGEPNELNNTATVGVDTPVELGFRFLFALGDADSEIRNELAISLNLETLSIAATVLLRVLDEKMRQFPLRYIPNGNCWMSLIPAPLLDKRGLRVVGAQETLSLTDLVATVRSLKLNASCVNCTSPGMASWAELLSTSEAASSATQVANEIFNYATKLLGGQYLQVSIDRRLNDARKSCPFTAEYDPNATASTYEPFQDPNTDESFTFLIMLGIAIGFILAAVGCVALMVKFIVRRRHRKWLNQASSDQVFFVCHRQNQMQKKEAAVNRISKSLFMSKEVPLWVRYFMPLVILGNIGFFLSGHLSLGATVNIVAKVADETFVVDQFYDFSLASSTIEIWNAGGKELALMILIFSGIWPYTKQIISLALWFSPPSVVAVTKRGEIFHWLDTLAKWSMVDIFVLVITVAGFRVSVQSPDVGFLPPDFYSLDLLVVPLWGLYANMIAQLISQISSHFIIHYHEEVVKSAALQYEREEIRSTVEEFDDGSSNWFTQSSVESEHQEPSRQYHAPSNELQQPSTEKDRLCQHTFSRPHRGETDKLVVRRVAKPLLVGGVALLWVLVVLGCVLPSFSLDILGIVGILVESGQNFEDATTEHSLFSVIGLLFEQAKFTGRAADYIGLGSLSILLIFTVLLVPLVQSSVLLFQWFRPITRKDRHRFAKVVETLQAWQYAEVYLLSVIIACWQLGPVSDFMVNAYCKGLREMFAQLVYYGILKEDDAMCFRVEAGIDEATFLLIAAAVILAFINTFVMKAVAQYFRDKEEEQTRGEVADLDDSVKENSMLAKEHVKPAPVLFSDRFRWFLTRENAAPLTNKETFLMTYSMEEANSVESSEDNADLRRETSPDEGEDLISSVDFDENTVITENLFSADIPHILPVSESDSSGDDDDSSALF